MSGYQNDVTFQADDLTNLPVETSSNNFAITTGQANDYQLSFQPPLTKYRLGLTIRVRFHAINTAASSLTIDGVGSVPIRKLIDQQLKALESTDLQTAPIYQLIYDGAVFQVTITTSSNATSTQGFWVDKGPLDAATTDSLPAGQRGDIYTISNAGTLGANVYHRGITVEKGDILQCIQDNSGGSLRIASVREGWNVIQSKIGNATESSTGVARFATTTELDQQAKDLMISPFLLSKSLSEFKRFGFDSTQVRAPGSPSTGQEENLSRRLIVPADFVKLGEGIKITAHGFFEHSNPSQATAINQRLRLYLGDLRIYQTSFNANPTGLFLLTSEIHRLSDTSLLGYSKMQLNGKQIEIQSIRQTRVSWTSELQIRMTIQIDQVGQINTITRYFWRADKLL